MISVNGYAGCVGRVGALALALGVGAAGGAISLAVGHSAVAGPRVVHGAAVLRANESPLGQSGESDLAGADTSLYSGGASAEACQSGSVAAGWDTRTSEGNVQDTASLAANQGVEQGQTDALLSEGIGGGGNANCIFWMPVFVPRAVAAGAFGQSGSGDPGVSALRAEITKAAGGGRGSIHVVKSPGNGSPEPIEPKTPPVAPVPAPPPAAGEPEKELPPVVPVPAPPPDVPLAPPTTSPEVIFVPPPCVGSACEEVDDDGDENGGGGGGTSPRSGQNPGNAKSVGNSKFDGITGNSQQTPAKPEPMKGGTGGTGDTGLQPGAGNPPAKAVDEHRPETPSGTEVSDALSNGVSHASATPVHAGVDSPPSGPPEGRGLESEALSAVLDAEPPVPTSSPRSEGAVHVSVTESVPSAGGPGEEPKVNAVRDFESASVSTLVQPAVQASISIVDVVAPVSGGLSEASQVKTEPQVESNRVPPSPAEVSVADVVASVSGGGPSEAPKVNAVPDVEPSVSIRPQPVAPAPVSVTAVVASGSGGSSEATQVSTTQVSTESKVESNQPSPLTPAISVTAVITSVTSSSVQPSSSSATQTNQTDKPGEPTTVQPTAPRAPETKSTTTAATPMDTTPTIKRTGTVSN